MPSRARRYIGSLVTSRPSILIEPSSAGNQPGDHVEHGGLAGAVRPEQSDRFAAADVEADAADDGALLEALDHGADGQPAGARIGPGSRRMVDRLRGSGSPLCGDCLAAWERQQFAHYPFRSLALKRRPVNISSSPETGLGRSAKSATAHRRASPSAGVSSLALRVSGVSLLGDASSAAAPGLALALARLGLLAQLPSA